MQWRETFRGGISKPGRCEVRSEEGKGGGLRGALRFPASQLEKCEALKVSRKSCLRGKEPRCQHDKPVDTSSREWEMEGWWLRKWCWG